MSAHLAVDKLARAGGRHRCAGECGTDSRSLSVQRRRVHCAEKPVDCAECDKRFSTWSKVAKRGRTHGGGGDRAYACYLCDKTFSEAGGLRRHVQVHTAHRPFTCSLCGQSFTRANNLHHHERHVHTSSRPCECLDCGKLFKRSKELKRHVLIHTDAKPYSCRHCSERFRWRNQLKTHLLKSHGRLLVCT